MNFVKLSAALTLATLLGGAAYADTAAPATLASCHEMKHKVEAALSANQQSPHYAQAHEQFDKATGYCTLGLFGDGMSGYAEALETLGASN